MSDGRVPELRFTVVGKAATAGSKRGFPVKRKDGSTGVALSDSSGAKGKAWRTDVQAAAGKAMELTGWAYATGPLTLDVEFSIPRPKGHYGTGKNSDVLKDSAPERPTGKPDLLKLTRSIEDALNGVAYKDDSQIVAESLSKVYCDNWERQTTNVTIRVWENGE